MKITNKNYIRLQKMEQKDEEVKTYPIGFAGLIYHFLQRQGLGKLLDSKLSLHGNRQGLGWGKLAEIFILYLLRSLYRMEDWYSFRPYVNMLYPDSVLKDFTDNPIGDLLDSINEYGTNELYNKLSDLADKVLKYATYYNEYLAKTFRWAATKKIDANSISKKVKRCVSKFRS